MKFELITEASPEQVLRALTDFSDRRPEIWSRTLDAGSYELRERGGTWAVARESTPRSPFWVVCRYDWSDPTVLRWTEVETSWGGVGGGGAVRIHPVDGGGSRLEANWSNGPATRRHDRLMMSALHHTPLWRLLARMWRLSLDDYARSDT